MWQGGRWEEISHLNQVDHFWWERRKKEGKEKKEKKKKSGERSSTFSKIYGDRDVGFRRSKRQSSSTRREFRVGTRIRGFHQTPRGRGFFPTLVILGLRVI